MKTLLVGINAKFIHTNLAIRYIRDYGKKLGHEIDIVEFTINQRLAYILAEIYQLKPDVISFSCYIWNIELVKQIVNEYKKIQPNVMIVLGGPEVSYDMQAVLEELPSTDIIICGEGEVTFSEILSEIKKVDGLIDLSQVNGIAYRHHIAYIGLGAEADREGITINQNRAPLNMDDLPFVYESGFEAFKNKIIYYESSRGCPFNCQYCLSSIEKGVRFRSIALVERELQAFLDGNVKQVKFVDRTFNCNKQHAMAIWRYLDAHDNGKTNFHFEISVDLVDDETIDFLETVRKELFQFEIGIQSTHKKTLDIIKRRNDFKKINHNVFRLKEKDNIHLHLDLIAGLPEENYMHFKDSFDEVYDLRPEQLQLGFLKILKGSGMHHMAKQYGIEYSRYAPYEVYKTSALSYDDMLRLKGVEDMLEQYYNSGLFKHTIGYIEKGYSSAFELFEELSAFYMGKGYYHLNHSRIGVINILKEFCETIDELDGKLIENLLVLDMCLHEKVKKYPNWYRYRSEYNCQIRDFYRDEARIAQYLPSFIGVDSKQISKIVHIEIFDYDLLGNAEHKYKKEITPIVFEYIKDDYMNAETRATKVVLANGDEDGF